MAAGPLLSTLNPSEGDGRSSAHARYFARGTSLPMRLHRCVDGVPAAAGSDSWDEKLMESERPDLSMHSGQEPCPILSPVQQENGSLQACCEDSRERGVPPTVNPGAAFSRLCPWGLAPSVSSSLTTAELRRAHRCAGEQEAFVQSEKVQDRSFWKLMFLSPACKCPQPVQEFYDVVVCKEPECSCLSMPPPPPAPWGGIGKDHGASAVCRLARAHSEGQ